MPGSSKWTLEYDLGRLRVLNRPRRVNLILHHHKPFSFVLPVQVALEELGGSIQAATSLAPSFLDNIIAESL